ncbi:ATP-binding protein [Streptomyces sp. NPDC001635]
MELTIVPDVNTPPRHTTAVLPRQAHSAARARRIVEAAAPDAGPLTDTAALLVSELVSNAVRHARGDSVQVTITYTVEEFLTCAVFDAEPRMTGGHRTTDGGSEEMETGRGLDLLDVLAHDWGATVVGDRGKWVWFSLTGA